MDEITDKTIEAGGILALLYFDMQSKTKEDLQPLMAELINNNLLKTKGVVYCYGSIEEPILVDEMFSSSAALTVLFENMSALINIAFGYTPAAIEILRPESEFRIKTNELQSALVGIAQISTNYSKYVLEKVLKKEDFESLEKNIQRREELGRKILEKKGHSPDSSS